jgi:lysophospholipase L1-like esterase
LDGACRFLGIKFEDGEIISLPYVEHQIEFLGDSITQGLRLLYTGSDDDTGHQLPYANWPQLTADLLCMKPVVTGFGGQGLSKSGTCGAPAANTAFPFIYQGAAWVPKVKPDAVVIYQGTNDRIPPDEFQNAYHAFLQSVRRTYPSSLIFAICPRGKPYAKAIQSAVQQMNDATISFLDYSSGLISKYETSDGCHLNPGGAIRFAIRLSHDIQDHLGRAK